MPYLLGRYYSSCRKKRLGLSLALSALCVLPSAWSQQGRDEPLQGRVINLENDHFAIDIGNSNIHGGDIAVVTRDGVQVGLATVVWVDVGTTRLRIRSTVANAEIRLGDLVVFQTDENRRQTEKAPTIPVIADQSGTEAEFVPLLAPIAQPKTAISRSANVFHGQIRGWHLYQTIHPSNAWYSASRLNLDGSIERLNGQPWSLVWSGNASRRDGNTFSSADDYQRTQPHLYRLTLTRKFQDSGLLRLGRFFPNELPSLGYIDGGQLEMPVANGLRLGGATGLRPDRRNQGFSAHEALGTAYATLEKGTPRIFYYTGTLGFLGTLFRNKPDELAAVYSHRVDLGPKLNMLGTAQFDFDAGNAKVHTKPRLTRADLNLNSPVSSWLSLRGGANHYEPLDIAAERELADGSLAYLNNGYWRYWVGALQTLPLNLQLDEDLSFTNSSDAFTPGQWRATLRRQGLPGLPLGTLSVTAYNLYNPIGPDYGGIISIYLPFLEGRLSIDGSLGMRKGPTSTSPNKSRLSDYSTHVTWRASASWMIDAGFSRAYEEQLQATNIIGGLTYRW